MKKLSVLSIIIVCFCSSAHPQGCIIVRNISGLGQYNLTSNSFSRTNWQISISNRYFKAYRDYIGKVDQHAAPANQNVIKSFSTDIEVTRLLANG